jgi:ribosomal protein S13
MTDLAVITGKIEKLKARPADARASIYGYNDTVSTSVLAQAQIDQAKKQISDLKKQKQKINDEVLELNIKTEIPLSDEIANVLAQEGLV